MSFTPARSTCLVGRNTCYHLDGWSSARWTRWCSGKLAAEAVAQQAQRLGATRVFLMVRRRKAASPVKDQVGQIAPRTEPLEAATPHVR